ncbi:hypothetical protein EAL2_c17710 [Peptoclostridium acidaminophilum DSM 3953]|uniref:Uncharacterized protein n=1 Tax=Peptoclostridium acidaminophilum DSM 3953 TaxID=1286171 RepID=W8U865_PEPAC|nr:hypothetical protein [Peptoclostridium acidaminophilum]AHM57066.1 hypothetical protein EAL2_c17710 [Peptoclostridium acidaminophilum DSM 3953]
MEDTIKEDLKNKDEQQNVVLEESSQDDSQMLFELVYGLVEAFEKIRVKSEK